MRSATAVTTCEEQTVALGRHIGELCAAGNVILLSGELGAGKTCLIQGIASGLAVSQYTFSPSFVLVREYRGRLMLYHMDFYRMETLEEVADLGIEEYLNGDGVCAIEWAERAAGLLPSVHLYIELQYVSGAEESRRIRVTALGARYERLLQQLTVTTRAFVQWN